MSKQSIKIFTIVFQKKTLIFDLVPYCGYKVKTFSSLFVAKHLIYKPNLNPLKKTFLNYLISKFIIINIAPYMCSQNYMCMLAL